MSIKFGSKPVGNSQRVASNQKESDAKKPLAVTWDRTVATIGQIVVIRGTVNVPANVPPQIDIWISFNGNRFDKAVNIKALNGQITAEWRVKPYKTGTFTDGSYDAEISYGSVFGKTTTPLRIVAGGGNRDVSSFG